MRIRIIKPGLLSTIQDLGRHRYLQQAVPVSGAMDTLSARIANKAVGNPDDAAVIEFTYAGAEFMVEINSLMAWSGDGAVLRSGSKVIPADRPVFIPAGTNIALANDPAGSRTYVAIAGGWDVPEVLGSRSTYITAAIGGLQGRALTTGDVLKGAGKLTPLSREILTKLQGDTISYPKWSIARSLFLPADRRQIRVVPAREFTAFNSRSVIDFLSTPYTLSLKSNRMGYHLEGSFLERFKPEELLSTAVTPGTIQVTGNGSMVILMADCQTTGGYPRIAQVAAVDLPLCGQLKPGDAISFTVISRQEAEMLYLEQESELHKLNMVIFRKFISSLVH